MVTADGAWQPPTRRSSRLVGGAVLAGAVVVFVGSFLHWFTVTAATGSSEVRGVDLPIGSGIDFLVVLVAAFGVVMLVRARKTGGRAWSIVALFFAAFVLILTAEATPAPESSITSWGAISLAEAWDISESHARKILEQGFANGDVNATSSLGAYLSFAGAILATGAAILGIVWAKRFRRVPETLPIPPLPAGPATA